MYGAEPTRSRSIRQELRSPCRRPTPISLGLVWGYPRVAMDMCSRFSSCSRAGAQRRGGALRAPPTPQPQGALRAPCSVQGPSPRKFNQELIKEEGEEDKEKDTWSLEPAMTKFHGTRANATRKGPYPIELLMACNGFSAGPVSLLS